MNDQCRFVLIAAAEWMNGSQANTFAAASARRGWVGAAESFLFEAPQLVTFAVGWLERFASTQPDREK